MVNDLEIIDIQNRIIKAQSDIIYEIFGMLCQYMTSNEIDSLPVVNKINDIARLKRVINTDCEVI